MSQQNADLNALLFHLKRCPPEFLWLPGTSVSGIVNSRALIMDVFRKVAGDWEISNAQLPGFEDDQLTEVNKTISIQIACWLLSHEFFKRQPLLLNHIRKFLFEKLPELCGYVNYKDWINDEDRAEELIRLALQCCYKNISGETPEESLDRFYALSTIKRQEVLQETADAMQRIKNIRQKMAEQKAREAANVYGRE